MQTFIEDRGIESLYHFTSLKNLDNILNNGLLSREILNKKDIEYEYNDEYRIDGKLDAICISISFPNYRMFYRYWSNTNDIYCVIELKPSILYEKNCLFCVENAASYNERQREYTEKMGREGIEKLFYDDFLREDLGIPRSYPTNPQSEVLVLDNIEVKYIKNIYFNVPEIDFDINKYSNMNIGFYYKTSLFSYRYDYEYWR